VRASSGRFAANCRSQAAPAPRLSSRGRRCRGFSAEATSRRHPAILPQRGGRASRASVQRQPAHCQVSAAHAAQAASALAFWCAAIPGGILPLRSGVAARRLIGCAARSFPHPEQRVLRTVRGERSVAASSSTSASRCCSVTSAPCQANQSLQWTQGRPYFQAPRGLQLTRRSSAFGAALRH
jgi:hypothetical protein